MMGVLLDDDDDDVDPVADKDQYGPQNPAYGGTEISRDSPRGLVVQGVTSDLATFGPVQDVLAQGILNKKITIRGLWMGLTSVVALAQFGLLTAFLLGPADDRRVSPSPLPRSRFS